jgi:phosphatidylglycerol lysyltransferase
MTVLGQRGAADALARALLTFVALADGTLSLERWAQHHRSVEWAAGLMMGLPALARLWVALAVAAAALYLATRPKRAFRRILLALALGAAAISLQSAQPGLIAAALLDAVVALFATSLWPEEGDPVSSRLGWSLLGVAAVSAALSGWLLLPSHRGPHPLPLFAAPMLLAFLAAVAGLALLDRNPPLPARWDPAAALSLYAGAARSSLTPFALMRDKRHLWASDGASFLAFGCRTGVALALGPPIGAPDSAARLQAEFRAACRRRGWRPAWYQVSEQDAAALPGTRRFLIGSEALIHPDRFGLEGRPMANLRHQVRKACRLGVSVEVLPESEVPRDVRSSMRALAEEATARARLGEMAFSVGRPDDPAEVERTVALAFHGGRRLVGYVTWLWLPAARTMVLDEVKRAAGAPSGTVELLMATSLREFRGRADVASLGLAPITGAGRALAARLLRDLLGLRSVSPGLYAFKAKFRPVWEPRYLVVERLVDVPAVLMAALLLHHPELARRSRALIPRPL